MNSRTYNSVIRLNMSWCSVFGRKPSKECVNLLVGAYKESHRFYHTLSHIDDCLNKLEKFWHLFQRPEEAGLAFWLHDAVYDPKRSDNEEKSAELARKLMEPYLNFAMTEAHRARMQLSIEHICSLILATKTHQGTSNDAQAFLDIDLSILASAPVRFARYESQIRHEYCYLDDVTYQKARHQFLLEMSCRTELFNHPCLAALWRHKANKNISSSLRNFIG